MPTTETKKSYVLKRDGKYLGPTGFCTNPRVAFQFDDEPAARRHLVRHLAEECTSLLDVAALVATFTIENLNGSPRPMTLSERRAEKRSRRSTKK